MPSAATASYRRSSLISLRPTYQPTEMTPIQIVAVLGVRKFGWIVPKRFGAARLAAIESAERVAGRIVVWQDAEADVSTAMIEELVPGRPEHVGAEAREHVVAVLLEEADAVVGLRGHGDERVDAEQHDRRDDRGLAGALGRVGRLLVDAHGRVPAPVDEDAEDQALRQRAQREPEGVEPLERRRDRAARCPWSRPSTARRSRRRRASGAPCRAARTACVRRPRCRCSRWSSSRSSRSRRRRARPAARAHPGRRGSSCRRPAMSARFAMTMMSAASTAQPAIQPSHGPIARVTHENVVPQSGSALLR